MSKYLLTKRLTETSLEALTASVNFHLLQKFTIKGGVVTENISGYNIYSITMVL